MRIVIALGGNAMTSSDGRARPEDQAQAVAQAAELVADLVVAGHDVLLTHGNGPQVGNLLLKNELSASVVPPVPLDWCGAQTQATIGALMLSALDGALTRRGSDRRSAALVSRTLVDAADPGFTDPTKPIGRYLPEDEARVLIEHGQHFVEVPDRGWRRVVASPEPLECLDGPAADTLLAQGYLVVCSGGGGIPTVRRDDGSLSGIEAVIDKDLTAALIARQTSADVLVIATDVDSAVTDWGTAHARPIGEVTVAEMRAISRDQGFAAGSMGPKVEAVTRFAEQTGGTGIITSLSRIAQAIEGHLGTRVVPDPPVPR
ncbi:Carbamate kinase 1 [Nocardioides dokdonensis FR1436]|uniref:Carbamate kinase n=1 Tax=Nocardioides dokdonensis FR1436 TaxID=1300347 RepID=A0A1A9GHJ0_9ACTN|nr:carbamate kinase [Nocardioides dokdonensis]ANH37758.1 Carbamate kinase 1 [Nocardioides dokdonensis FR1436]